MVAQHGAEKPLPQYTVGGVTYTILFPDLIRPMTPQERAALKASIEAEGAVLVPILVDEHNGVIDGGHRLTIASELGLEDVPTKRFFGTDEEKRKIAEDLNDCRRHQTPEEIQARRRQRVQEVATDRQQGMSLPALAEKHGVSVAQVQRDLDVARPGLPGGKPGSAVQAGAPEGAPAPSGPVRVVGKDGKNYPARVVPNRARKPTPTPPASAKRDDQGNEIPERMLDAFGDMTLPNAVEALDGILSLLLRNAWSRWNPYLTGPLERQATDAIETALDILRSVMPESVHAECEGKGCQYCRTVGWQTRAVRMGETGDTE